MSLLIPSRFKLLGHTIEVKENPRLSHDTDCVGQAIYRQNLIELQPDLPGCPRPSDKVGHDFCHELMHFLLYYGSSSINGTQVEYAHKDEEFVDLMAGLLHQALTTMEFDSNVTMTSTAKPATFDGTTARGTSPCS